MKAYLQAKSGGVLVDLRTKDGVRQVRYRDKWRRVQTEKGRHFIHAEHTKLRVLLPLL